MKSFTTSKDEPFLPCLQERFPEWVVTASRKVYRQVSPKHFAEGAFAGNLGPMRVTVLYILLSLMPISGLAASSAWVESNQAASRLVAAESAVAPGARSLKLGWQVRLAPGWKTYWRNPGDAGLPPRFDWSGSENVKVVEVGWPVPERLTAFGYDTVVYAHEVVLPVTVALAKPSGPAVIDLKIDYMVCEEICIPLRAAYRLALPAGEAEPDAEAGLIAKYKGRVPSRQKAIGPQAGDGAISLLSAALTPEGLDLSVRSTGGGDGLDAFVDGPDTVAFGRPAVTRGSEAGLYMLKVPVYGAGAPSLAGHDLSIVLVNGSGDAIEWRGRLSK